MHSSTVFQPKPLGIVQDCLDSEEIPCTPYDEMLSLGRQQHCSEVIGAHKHQYRTAEKNPTIAPAFVEPWIAITQYRCYQQHTAGE